MRRALLALCSLFLLTTAGTCDSDGPTSTDATIVGSYTLVSINGDALPADFEDETITAGSATVNADHTFTYSETSTPSGTFNISGTWSQSGSTYTFHPTTPPGQTDGTGTFAGSTLTITTEDQVIVLAKQ